MHKDWLQLQPSPTGLLARVRRAVSAGAFSTWAALVELCADDGTIAKTAAELCAALDVRTSTLRAHLAELIESGCLQRHTRPGRESMLALVASPGAATLAQGTPGQHPHSGTGILGPCSEAGGSQKSGGVEHTDPAESLAGCQKSGGVERADPAEKLAGCQKSGGVERADPAEKLAGCQKSGGVAPNARTGAKSQSQNQRQNHHHHQQPSITTAAAAGGGGGGNAKVSDRTPIPGEPLYRHVARALGESSPATERAFNAAVLQEGRRRLWWAFDACCQAAPGSVPTWGAWLGCAREGRKVIPATRETIEFCPVAAIYDSREALFKLAPESAWHGPTLAELSAAVPAELIDAMRVSREKRGNTTNVSVAVYVSDLRSRLGTYDPIGAAIKRHETAQTKTSAAKEAEASRLSDEKKRREEAEALAALCKRIDATDAKTLRLALDEVLPTLGGFIRRRIAPLNDLRSICKAHGVLTHIIAQLDRIESGERRVVPEEVLA